jgi:hypothetical protein
MESLQSIRRVPAEAVSSRAVSTRAKTVRELGTVEDPDDRIDVIFGQLCSELRFHHLRLAFASSDEETLL